MFKQPARTESAGTDTVIAAGVKVEGDFVSAGNIVIDGEVSGTLKTAMDLIVGPDAKITADVSARSARIAGEVVGNVTASDRIELSATARVTGDIRAKVMVMEAGAVMNGRCAMGGAPAERPAPEPEAPAALRSRPAKLEP